jgi:hypothetical protein
MADTDVNVPDEVRKLPPLEQTALQLRLLFDPDDNVCYKPDVYTRSEGPAAFFCINPLRDPAGKVSLENIACYRNILIEFDRSTLAQQAKKYEERYRLPYTTKTFSGSKSLHYIISLEEPVTLAEYQLLNVVLHAVLVTCDTSTKNPNRLSRTAGQVRKDKNKEQTLLGTGERIAYKKLMNHLAFMAPMVYVRAFQNFQSAELEKARREAAPIITKDDMTPLLGWVQYMLKTGKYDGTSRHAALVRVASALNGEGYSLDRIEQVLYELQDKFALDRNDVPGIMKFICRR